MGCVFCEQSGGEVLWQGMFCRVVLAAEPEYPGFCRVILNQHLKEMTDLAPADRVALMDVVWAVEGGVRQILHPDKINLASLGNQVAHVHWHVIPRFVNDRHFPYPVWSEPVRDATECDVEPIVARLGGYLERVLGPSSSEVSSADV